MSKQGRLSFLTKAFRDKGGKPKNFSDTFDKQLAMPNVMERFYRQQAEDNFPDKPEQLKERWVQMKLREHKNKLKKHTEEMNKIKAFQQELQGKNYKPPRPLTPEEQRETDFYLRRNQMKVHRVQPRTIGPEHPRTPGGKYQANRNIEDA